MDDLGIKPGMESSEVMVSMLEKLLPEFLEMVIKTHPRDASKEEISSALKVMIDEFISRVHGRLSKKEDFKGMAPR